MSGYKVIKIEGKSKDQHRHMMEVRLKRKLTYNEIVHHKDENKKNNYEENFEIMTRGEHSTYHNKKRFKNHKVGCICSYCGEKFSRMLSQYKRSKNQYCSKKCSQKLNLPPKPKPYFDHDYIKNELKNGKSGYAIAKELSCSKALVYYIAKKNNIALKTRIRTDVSNTVILEEMNSGFGYRKIAKKYSWPKSLVKDRMRKIRRCGVMVA